MHIIAEPIPTVRLDACTVLQDYDADVYKHIHTFTCRSLPDHGRRMHDLFVISAVARLIYRAVKLVIAKC